MKLFNDRGAARRLRGVRGFSVRSARLGSSQQTPPLCRMVPPLRRPRAAALASVARSPGALSHRLSSLAGCQFPIQGSLGFPKRKATPPKSAGSLQVSSSKFR